MLDGCHRVSATVKRLSRDAAGRVCSLVRHLLVGRLRRCNEVAERQTEVETPRGVSGVGMVLLARARPGDQGFWGRLGRGSMQEAEWLTFDRRTKTRLRTRRPESPAGSTKGYLTRGKNSGDEPKAARTWNPTVATVGFQVGACTRRLLHDAGSFTAHQVQYSGECLANTAARTVHATWPTLLICGADSSPADGAHQLGRFQTPAYSGVARTNAQTTRACSATSTLAVHGRW